MKSVLHVTPGNEPGVTENWATANMLHLALTDKPEEPAKTTNRKIVRRVIQTVGLIPIIAVGVFVGEYANSRRIQNDVVKAEEARRAEIKHFYESEGGEKAVQEKINLMCKDYGTPGWDVCRHYIEAIPFDKPLPLQTRLSLADGTVIMLTVSPRAH